MDLQRAQQLETAITRLNRIKLGYIAHVARRLHSLPIRQRSWKCSTGHDLKRPFAYTTLTQRIRHSNIPLLEWYLQKRNQTYFHGGTTSN